MPSGRGQRDLSKKHLVIQKVERPRNSFCGRVVKSAFDPLGCQRRRFGGCLVSQDADAENPVDWDSPLPLWSFFQDECAGRPGLRVRRFLRNIEQSRQRTTGQNLASKSSQAKQNRAAAVGNPGDVQYGRDRGGNPCRQSQAQRPQLKQQGRAGSPRRIRGALGEQRLQLVAVTGRQRPVKQARTVGERGGWLAHAPPPDAATGNFGCGLDGLDDEAPGVAGMSNAGRFRSMRACSALRSRRLGCRIHNAASSSSAGRNFGST